jgi:hypothetical protein
MVDGLSYEDRELVVDALEMAVWRRKPSGRGSSCIIPIVACRADSIGRSNTPDFGGVQWDVQRVGVRR